MRDVSTVLSCLRDLPTALSYLPLVFYSLQVQTETCVPFFKYTTVERWKVCVLFARMDCSQELMTQGKAVPNIWNAGFACKSRAVLAA